MNWLRELGYRIFGVCFLTCAAAFALWEAAKEECEKYLRANKEHQ